MFGTLTQAVLGTRQENKRWGEVPYFFSTQKIDQSPLYKYV
jgi:hypothetical protein